MKQRIVLNSIMILLVLSCSQMHQRFENRHSTGKLFIIGGGDRPAELVDRMINEAGLREKGYVVILPMASSVPDSAFIWSKEQFIDQGIIDVVVFNFRAGELPGEARLDSLRNAALIYISGGDQNTFMGIVAGTGIATAIEDAWEKGAMIAGTSAGAAVMSRLMITGNELRATDYRETFRSIESSNLELGQGLGLLENVIIDQHFIRRSRHNRLFSAVIEHPELMGIGIDESTAILVKNNRAEVVGSAQVMIFRNPGKSKTEAAAKLGARDLRVDILLAGDTFALE
jgi:cyanophycinase